MDEHPRVHAISPPRPGPTAPVYLDRTARRAYGGDCAFLRAPHHRADIGTYLSDMLRPYGLAVDEDRLATGTGQSYGEMAADLIGEVVRADEPVDVLVVAFAVPDVRPGRATATYLSHLCPGNPHAFAVCDQGVAAAYTGLLLLREYLGAGAGERGLLLVLEQATLHYARAGAAPLPTGHDGVALLCGRGPGRVRLESARVHADVTPDLVGSLLEREVAGRVPATIVAGGGVDREHLEPLTGRDGRPVAMRHAPNGRPYTGVWWELAAMAGDATDGGGRVTLVDYDPALRYLCTASVQRAGSRP
jgi:hypothetical protein